MVSMLNDKSFLYVEDDFPSREVVRRIMHSMGVHRLTIFEDSTDFMTRYKALDNRPDVVMLDIHMKPHTGFEMLRMLRADPDSQSVIVVALTASVMSEEVELLKTSGFAGVIGKPIRMRAFPELLEDIVRGEAVWYIA